MEVMIKHQDCVIVKGHYKILGIIVGSPGKASRLIKEVLYEYRQQRYQTMNITTH
jgi:hypothetical protein